eukprot:6490278-Amphidinium_carterae.2
MLSRCHLLYLPLLAPARPSLAILAHILIDELLHCGVVLAPVLPRSVCHLAINRFNRHIGVWIDHGQENDAKLNELLMFDRTAVNWLLAHVNWLSDVLDAQTMVRTNQTTCRVVGIN